MRWKDLSDWTKMLMLPHELPIKSSLIIIIRPSWCLHDPPRVMERGMKRNQPWVPTMQYWFFLAFTAEVILYYLATHCMLAHNEARQTAMVNMYNTAIQYLPTSRASMHADNSLPESVCKCVLSTVVNSFSAIVDLSRRWRKAPKSTIVTILIKSLL